MSITSTFTNALGLTNTLDSDMQKVLDTLANLNPQPIEALTPEAARQQPTPADAVKQLLLDEGKSVAPEAVAEVKHLTINGPNGDIPLHVFIPQGSGPFPVVLYFHGGGFVIASSAVYEATPRALANAVQAVVVSVDYHLAPEYKYPAAPQDAYAAYRWVLHNALQINGIPGRVAVAGESAGGNLATVVALKAREDNVHMPLHQLLVYPVVDNDFNTSSYLQNADAKPLNMAMMHWFFKHYDASERLSSDWPLQYALPLQAASLHGLPPATVITAEVDPLCSEGKAYAERLKQAGVEVSYQHYDGVTHEFFGMGSVVEKASEALQFAAEQLRLAFSGEVVDTRDPSILYTGFKVRNAHGDDIIQYARAMGSPDPAQARQADTQMTHEDIVATLNALIETCKDGESGFLTCAEDISDPVLKTSFIQRAESCAEGAEELVEVVRALGGDPETNPSLSGMLHRRWIDIKAAIVGRDEAAVLDECERGEDIAMRNYRHALEKDLPDYIRAIVERQLVGVKANHDEVKQLRDQAEARS